MFEYRLLAIHMIYIAWREYKSKNSGSPIRDLEVGLFLMGEMKSELWSFVI